MHNNTQNLIYQDEPATLPCLNSNISIEIDNKVPCTRLDLSTTHLKTSYILELSIAELCRKYGIEKLAFQTLTFKDHITDHKEASKRLNSLLSHVIKPRYKEYIGCVERQKSGRIHFHLILVVDQDIKTGFDFDQVKNRNYSSASKYLKEEWSFWRLTAPKYKFGRTELMPIKSNAKGISKYVAKYIGKHLLNRLPEDKGARLVRYSNGARCGNTRFMFLTEGSATWRNNLQIFADHMGKRHDFKIENTDDIKNLLGKKWSHEHREKIININSFITHYYNNL